MKTRTYLRILILVLGSYLTNSYSYGQDALKTKQKTDSILVKGQRDFYRKSLQIDSAKADKVLTIQNVYKKNLYTLMADTTIKGTRRQEGIQALMDKKNLELKKFLNPAQQAKIIPASEEVTKATEVKKD